MLKSFRVSIFLLFSTCQTSVFAEESRVWGAKKQIIVSLEKIGGFSRYRFDHDYGTRTYQRWATSKWLFKEGQSSRIYLRSSDRNEIYEGKISHPITLPHGLRFGLDFIPVHHVSVGVVGGYSGTETSPDTDRNTFHPSTSSNQILLGGRLGAFYSFHNAFHAWLRVGSYFFRASSIETYEGISPPLTWGEKDTSTWGFAELHALYSPIRCVAFSAGPFLEKSFRAKHVVTSPSSLVLAEDGTSQQLVRGGATDTEYNYKSMIYGISLSLSIYADIF